LKLNAALPAHRYEPIIDVADSRMLPIEDEAVDLVVTSPPYLTRIDYAVATSPELAILGPGDVTSIRSLRDRMIGTPTLADSEDLPIGEAGRRFLGKVELHPSKASSTYYLKYFKQYVTGLAASLSELGRVTKPRATCVLVVQDSYYKEIRCDLAGIVADAAGIAGLDKKHQIDFAAPRTMASINKGSRRYRSTFLTTESAVVLERQRSGVVS
jgi:hypothetical protein